jgi:molybdopterin/thiamine biosynthesis adenylyltransferase
MADDLGEAEVQRYARQIVLPEIGGTGQLRLRRARVLVVGSGGLGSPMLLYLAAAGVGTLGIVDSDEIELSNLHRQVLFTLEDLGERKVTAAKRRLLALNPMLRIQAHDTRLTSGNAAELIASYDIVADGSDTLATRTAVHDACRRLRRPLVSGSVQGIDGQLTTFKSYLGGSHPCLHCLFDTTTPTDALPTCAQGGVLGPAAGVIGSLQAVEVIKEVLGMEPTLSGVLLIYDAVQASVDRIRVSRRPDCVACAAESYP